MLRIASASLAAVLLSGCIFGDGGASEDVGGLSGGGGSGGGSSGGSGVRCAELGRGATTTVSTSSPCNNCAAADNAKAVDGDLGSYATVSVGQSLPSTGVRVLAHGPAGMSYPAGTRPGVLSRVPANTDGYTITVRTLLDGVQQESGETSSTNPGDPDAYYYFGLVAKATKAYDSIEILVSDQQLTPGDTASFKLLEFCSDGPT